MTPRRTWKGSDLSGAASRRGVAVALATSERVPDLVADDRLLLPALAAHGIDARPEIWDDPAVDWRRYDAVVVRSCWDYHHKPEQFDGWTRRLEADGVPLWNPPALVRWNARKTYLSELARSGIPIVPTRFVAGPDAPGLDRILAEEDWPRAVVKPVVSASAYETWRTARGDAQSVARFAQLAGRMPMMVQPYLEEIERDGEWSLCFFGGRFSHAVLKRPQPGDFRVQTDHGGVVLEREAGAELVAEAEAALAAAGGRTVYARVDGCLVGGVLHLMELELIEPGLFLSVHPEAPARFAAAIAAALRADQE